MSIRADDLPDYLNKVVTAQYDVTSEGTDEDFREVTGKVLAVSPDGLVIQTRSSVVIVDMNTLLDLEAVSQSAKLMRRWISEVDPLRAQQDIYQHLIDQHNLPRVLVIDMSIQLAVDMHGNLPCDTGLGARDFLPSVPVRLTRRWIAGISAVNVRQHLLDRHGMPFPLIKDMNDEQAHAAHAAINHQDLGHAHGEKPQRRPGRPRKDELVGMHAGGSEILGEEVME